MRILTVVFILCYALQGAAQVQCPCIAPWPHSCDSICSNELVGAGSATLYPLFIGLFSKYGGKVNYQAVGSGAGINQLTNKQVDFGVSDVPLRANQDSALYAPVLNIPVATFGVVLIYHLPGITGTLRLSPGVLAGIFLGKVTRWNDREIALDNKEILLPDIPIVAVHRSDRNGITDIFTTYLTKVSGQWSESVGIGPTVNWPTGQGGKGNEGVAGLVKEIPGAISYVEFTFAEQNKIPFASIRNKAGGFITPTIGSITAAGNIQIPADAKVSLTNTDAYDGYPISAFSYILIYKEQNYKDRSRRQAASLVNLLSWIIHEGQQDYQEMKYSSLAPPAVRAAELLLRDVTFNGKRLLH